MPPLDAIDALRRGLANLRANWELVFVQWAGSLVVGSAVIAGFLPPLLILAGGGLATLASGGAQALGRKLAGLASDPARLVSGPMLAALLATAVIWTFALAAHCWFLGGTYGVLAAGDRQAPPGPPRDSRFLRTFSLRDFSGWAGGNVWRFFWFVNLFFLLFTALATGVALLVIGAVLLGRARGVAAGVGLGCGGALPLVFLALVAGLGFTLGLADLVRESSGILTAARNGFRILGRRLGGVLLLYLLVIVAGMGLGILFFVPTLALDFAFRNQFLASLPLRAVLMILQWLVSALLNIAFAGAVVGLVRSEVERARSGS